MKANTTPQSRLRRWLHRVDLLAVELLLGSCVAVVLSANLSTAQTWEISATENPRDRNVALKQALGVPAEIFTKANELLR